MPRLNKQWVKSEMIAVDGKTHSVEYPVTTEDPRLIAALLASGAKIMREPRVHKDTKEV